jgi:hypothetical protein
MFPREQFKVHAEYEGFFFGEVIPSPMLGSPRMQHMSNPHNFEVWPVECGPRKLYDLPWGGRNCVPCKRKISYVGKVGLSYQGSFPHGDLSRGIVFFMEGFFRGMSTLGCFLLGKKFPS